LRENFVGGPGLGKNKVYDIPFNPRSLPTPPLFVVDQRPGVFKMTIQPTFRFARHRQVAVAEDADQPVDRTPSAGEKGASTAADRTPSLSSVVSDEKQTFGVSKVEAVTTVWTKVALITLYVLSVAPI